MDSQIYLQESPWSKLLHPAKTINLKIRRLITLLSRPISFPLNTYNAYKVNLNLQHCSDGETMTTSTVGPMLGIAQAE